jgi:hypothetical protein
VPSTTCPSRCARRSSSRLSFYAMLRLIRRFRPPTLDTADRPGLEYRVLPQNPETFQRKHAPGGRAQSGQVLPGRAGATGPQVPTQRLTAATAVDTRNASSRRKRPQPSTQARRDAARRLMAAENAATTTLSRVIATETELQAVTARLVAAREAETAVSTSNLRRAKKAVGVGAAECRAATLASTSSRAPGRPADPRPLRCPVPGRGCPTRRPRRVGGEEETDRLATDGAELAGSTGPSRQGRPTRPHGLRSDARWQWADWRGDAAASPAV